MFIGVDDGEPGDSNRSRGSDSIYLFAQIHTVGDFIFWFNQTDQPNGLYESRLNPN